MGCLHKSLMKPPMGNSYRRALIKPEQEKVKFWRRSSNEDLLLGLRLWGYVTTLNKICSDTELSKSGRWILCSLLKHLRQSLLL